MRRKKGLMKYLLLLLLIPSVGCLDRLHRVKLYQERATKKCEETHTPEQCKPLSTPACEPGNFGGKECQ